MSSVQQEVTCAHCKSPEAFEEFNNRTNINVFFCPCCGSSKEENLRTGEVLYSHEGKGTVHAVFRKKYGNTSALRRRLPHDRQRAHLAKWAASPRRHVSSLTFTHRDKKGKWQESWVVGGPERKKSWKHKPRKPVQVLRLFEDWI